MLYINVHQNTNIQCDLRGLIKHVWHYFSKVVVYLLSWHLMVAFMTEEEFLPETECKFMGNRLFRVDVFF